MGALKPLADRSLLILLGIALALYLAMGLLTLGNPRVLVLLDSLEFIAAARNLLGEGLLYAGELGDRLRPELFTRRTPLYPVVIAAAYSIVESNYMVSAVQIGMTFLNAVLLRHILALLQVPRRAALPVVALYLLYPAQIVYSYLLMAEVLLQTTLFVALYGLVRYHFSGRVGWLLFFNFCLALAPLAKPVMIFFWVPNLFFHAWLFFRSGRRIAPFLALLPLLSVLGWSARNQVHTDYFHFTSIQAVHMLRFNAAAALGAARGIEEGRRTVREIHSQAREEEGLAETSRLMQARGLQLIRDHWWTYGKRHARGMVFFFLDPGRFDLHQFLGRPHERGFFHHLRHGWSGILHRWETLTPGFKLYLSSVALVNLVLLLSALVFVFRQGVPIPVELRVFVILVLVYVSGVTGPLGASRFRVAVLPFLFLTLASLLVLAQRQERSPGRETGKVPASGKVPSETSKR